MFNRASFSCPRILRITDAASFGEWLSHGRHVRGHQGGIEGELADLAMIRETQGAVALTSNEGPNQTWLLAEHITDLLAAEGAKH